MFHKNPYAPPKGIDLIRLRSIVRGLIKKGQEAEIIAPVDRDGMIEDIIPVRRLSGLDLNRYNILKTSYHESIKYVDNFDGPIVSRIVRVVDEKYPERDERFRKSLLQCQEVMAQKSAGMIFNNEANAERWRRDYGNRQKIAIIPSGCPAKIPPKGKNPYSTSSPVLLFLGSIASERMLNMLNDAAARLAGVAEIHFVGLNKVGMYGAASPATISEAIISHGELPEAEVWDYIRFAQMGVAIAAGPHPFDNDLSKMFSYLRGGLPILAEERIATNYLIKETGHGCIFKYDDLDGLVARALQMNTTELSQRAEKVMNHMVRNHSWTRRVEAMVQLFRSLL